MLPIDLVVAIVSAVVSLIADASVFSVYLTDASAFSIHLTDASQSALLRRVIHND